MSSAPARVAVIGAGAVGCYYGARLAQAGHEVHFLMRRDYEAVAARGLRIRSKDGDFALPAPGIARRPEDIGAVDWVLCALKATAIDEARALVAPCVADQTRILAVMNGIGIEERFAGWFGSGRVFGGLAFTCINRGDPGEVHHLDYGPLTIGHFADDAAELATAAALWKDAQVSVTTSPSLLAARWQKLAWNVPFNGLAVAAGGITTDRILAQSGLREAADATIREVAAAGNADLEAHGQAARLDPAALAETMIALTEAMAVYRPSTMIDFVEGRPMEVAAIFEEPVRRARELGVPVPHMALLAALLRALDEARGAREGERALPDEPAVLPRPAMTS